MNEAEAQEPAVIPEITVVELKQLMDEKADEVLLLDVRNPHEYEIARIPGAVLVPLADIENGAGVEQVRSLLNGNQLVVHCRSGVRSAKALSLLKEQGIEGANVKGGIKAWSREIDSSVPQY